MSLKLKTQEWFAAIFPLSGNGIRSWTWPWSWILGKVLRKYKVTPGFWCWMTTQWPSDSQLEPPVLLRRGVCIFRAIRKAWKADVCLCFMNLDLFPSNINSCKGCIPYLFQVLIQSNKNINLRYGLLFAKDYSWNKICQCLISFGFVQPPSFLPHLLKQLNHGKHY